MKKLPLNIIFEDSYLLVIDKPSGLVVNKSETLMDESVESILEKYYKEALVEKERAEKDGRKKKDADGSKDKVVDEIAEETEDINTGSILERSGIVHRLDKETSGLLILAKDPDTFASLQKAFKERKVKKTYIAVVCGHTLDEEFSVNAPIARNPRNRMRFCVALGGKAATTDFEKIKDFMIGENKYSTLYAYPYTGRTHQIRVHLVSYGHVIAGDSLYAGKETYLRSMKDFGRLMLHAYKIEFNHPVSGKLMNFEAKLPDQFLKF